MDKKYLNILNHFGVKGQLKKFNEECFELVEAISDYENQNKYMLDNNKESFYKCKCHIMEEMCDVLILFNQFYTKYDFNTDDFVKMYDYKLSRTLKRIETGYYDKK